MQNFLCIINGKAYEEGFGGKGERLFHALEEAKGAFPQVTLMYAPATIALSAWQSRSSLSMLAQHVDPYTPGAHTGFLPPLLLKSIGVRGSLLNHAEHPLSQEVLAETILLMKKEQLLTVCCAENLERAQAIEGLSPDYIAIEPPELIGGDISISTANPDIIRDAHRSLTKSQMLVGAGIKTGKDVEIAISLGAQGILVASGIVKAEDPKSALFDLLSGFPRQ
jgi:triosephosphate isomerase